MMKFVVITFLGIVGLLTFVACATDDEEYKRASTAASIAAAPTAAPTMAPIPAATPRATTAPTMAPAAAPRATAAPATAAPTMAPMAELSSAARPMSTPMAAATPAPTAAPAYRNQPVSLSAGKVNDNERWQEYLNYRKQYLGPGVHEVDISERYIITVSDPRGAPVHNAVVRVSAGQSPLFEGRTYVNGQTLFFPLAFAASEGVETFNLVVEKDGISQRVEFSRDSEREWNVTLDLERSSSEGVPLDVLFLLDSTGSMADEIDQIKATLLSISSRIVDLPSQPDLRFGMVAYRDRGDEFVTRLYDFDDDVKHFHDTIRNVVADGGDDTPESLNEAYHVAVREPDWRLGNAIRLIFLIADAPPHLDYPDDYSYAEEMMEAHRRGIKTFAIATSGLDEQGEYVFRQIAQHTMGQFVFLVYGPGGSTSHNVGEYTVERLDDLVVSLVKEELALLSQ